MRRLLRRGAPVALAWSAAWLVSAALYLLLIDITDLPELLVGAGIVTLAATGFELAREQHIAAERIRLGWLGRAYRPLAKVPADIGFVVLAAARQLVRRDATVGEFRAVAFPKRGDDELADGRAALAESLGSFAPNTIIVGVDRERGLILGHQLRRNGDKDAVDLLELGGR
jgi:hypothetical protein